MVAQSPLAAWAKTAPIGARVRYAPEFDGPVAARLYKAGKIMRFQRMERDSTGARIACHIAVRLDAATITRLEHAGRAAWAALLAKRRRRM
jgi:hypothetical protein